MPAKNNKKNPKLLSLLSLFLFLVIFNFSPQATLAQNFDFEKDSGMDVSANIAGFATGNKAETVDSIIGLAIYIILGFVGTIFLILIIYSGIQWMTAQDNDIKVNKAKGVLLNAIVGLVITLGAYVLSYFIISNFS